MSSRISQVATWTTRRSYAFQAAAPPIHQVFSRRAKWLQKERAAGDVETSRVADYLKDEVAIRLCDRLLVRSHFSLSFFLSLSPLYIGR